MMRCYQTVARALSIVLLVSMGAWAAAQTPVALPYTMTTIAGGLAPASSYTAGTTVCPGISSRTATTSSGDNCAAVSGIFGSAGRSGVAVDQSGNVFVGDDISYAIHQIDQNTGLMTLVAGLGTSCSGKTDYFGDGCPAATGTTMKGIRGISVDPYGNVLFADYNTSLVRMVCRAASPLCTSSQVGYSLLLAGCLAATSSTSGTAGVGLDNTPAKSVGTTCTTSLGETDQPRGVAADKYGNVYYADTTTDRIRVVLGPYTSSYFSGYNPLWAALKTHWSSPTQGYVYTVVNVAGTAVTTGGTASTTGSTCLSSITGNGSEVYTYSGTATALDSRGDGCPYWDSSVDYKSGAAFMIALGVDASGNLVFTDPGSGTLTYGGLRVFYVNGSDTAGTLMKNAILLNNTSLSAPQVGYIYALAGGGGMAGTSTTAVSTTPVLGNSLGISDSTTTKLTVSPQGNIYIGDSSKVLFYDIYTGTLRTLLSSGASNITAGNYCNGGSSGQTSKSKYSDGCAASQAYWGNGSGLGVAVDGQGNLYLHDANGLSGGMLVRKVLAQGVGTQPLATQQALASTTTSYPLNPLGVAETQTFNVHFPSDSAGTATLTNSSNSNFSLATPSCTEYSSDSSADCTVTSTFTPTVAGLQSGAFTLTAGSGEVATVSLSGTAAGSSMAIDNVTLAGTSSLTTASLLSGYTPTAIAADALGNLYEAAGTSILESLAASSSTAQTLASGLSAAPTKIAVDAAGNIFYLNGSSTIQELALTKAGVGSAATYTNSTLAYTPNSLATANPTAIATDSLGNVYVADTQSSVSTIYKLSPTALSVYGQTACSYPSSSSVLPSLCQSTVYSVGAFGTVTALAVDQSGSIYVGDSTNSAVYKLTATISSGLYTYTKSTVVSSVTATGLATDAAGDLYVQSGTTVVMYPVSGPTTAGVSILTGITTPVGLAVDGAGNVYSADSSVTSVTEVVRGAYTVDFGSDYSKELDATLTNVGNQVSTAQTTTTTQNSIEENPGAFTLAGGSSNGCTFSSNALAAMSAGKACTMTAYFPAIGSGELYDYIAFTATSPSTVSPGQLTLQGLADLEGYDTTVTIGDPSTTATSCTVTTSGSASSCVYVASGTEAAFPITITSNGTSTDGTTTITSGPTTSNYVNVSVDSGTAVSYAFTSTSGLTANVTLSLSGLTAGTHTFTVTFPQQGSFLESSATYSGLTLTSITPAITWTPSATTQQVSAPIGTGVLDAAISGSVAGNFAYAYGAAPSCTSTTAASSSTPIDASTYLAIGSYTLYTTFCPTDTTDYNSISAQMAYTVTQATTTAAVGASTMVVAPSGGNYTSLTTALQALPVTGGTIYIAPGIYSGQNAISYPNVALRGLGGDPTQVILTGENGAFQTSAFTTSTLPSGFSFGPAGKGGDEGSATLDVSKNGYQGQTATSSTYIPNNFYAEYLTIQNTYNTSTTTTSTETASSNGGTCSAGTTANTLRYLYNNNMQCASQALAMWITSDQAVMNNVNLVSQQDTLYAATQGCGTYCTSVRQYMWQGLITGDVDYIFGDAALVMDHTNIFTTWHGLTATGNETIEAQNKRFATGTTSTTNSSYASSSDYLSGFVCNACTLLSQSSGMSKLYYGRPYNISSSTYAASYSTWIMLNSNVDQVNASGWIGWDGSSQYLSTSTYGEFNTTAYTDPTPGTSPYPYALFNAPSATTEPSVLYSSDASDLDTSTAYYYGNSTAAYALAGGNSGSGATSLSSRESYALQLNAGTAAPWYPVNFLSTTVPSTKLSSGDSSSWNPVSALTSWVNAAVPTSSVGSLTYGSSVTIIGRPQTPGAGVIPTGTYTFYDSVGTNQTCSASSSSCTALQSGSLDGSGEAYLTTSSLASGTHYITMVYGGDSNFAGSTSSVYSIKVLASGLSAATATLSVANTSSTYGTAVTGSVTVSPTAATGTTTIYVDGVLTTSCTLSSGTCSWSITAPSTGTHTIYAYYPGDSSYGDATTSSVSIAVVAATATGDTRTVTEPSFPSVCQQLTAALTTNSSTQDLDTSVDATTTNPDGARIQAALTACAGTGKAVELSMDSTSTYNAFLSGPLTMPSNVTLLVDPNVTLYFSRNVQDYDKVSGTNTCGTINAASNTSSCAPLIDIPKTSTNVGIMGYGKLNGRGGDALLNAFTTSGYAMPSSPTWWSISSQANGEGNQQNPRFIQMDSGTSNVTLYKITLLNSPHFHVSTTGTVTGFTAWDVKIVTPTAARNTDGIDPSSVVNGTITKSWVSGGDDNIAVGASSNPATNISVTNNHFFAGHGESIGSYTGGGVSNVLFDSNVSMGNAWAGYGSATLTGVADTNSTAIRIKTANDRGGLVTNIQYSNSCFYDHKADIQFTPYYSSGDSTSALPSYTNILLQNLLFKNDASSYGTVELTGEYNTNNGSAVTNPLGVTFDNVTFPSALSALVNSTAAAESSTTSSAWGTNTSGGTGQYVNLTLGPGTVSSNFLSAYNNLVAVSANNDTLTSNVSITALDPPSCVITYLAPELASPNGDGQTVYYGNAATLYVIETPAVGGAPYPTGTVTVTDTTTGNSYTGTLSGVSDTVAVTIPAADLTVGTHSFTASYTGDSNYTVPSSYQTFGAQTVTVTAAPQTITFSPTTTSYTYASGLTFTVSATSTSGLAVSFTSKTTGVCTVSGSTVSVLTAGACTIEATQPGDSNYQAATAVDVTFTISQATPTVTLASSTNPALVGGSVKFTATVSSTAGTPTGTVTFKDGTTTLGTGTIASGSASFTTTALTAGTHSITAVYAGDTNFATLTSSTLTETIVSIGLSISGSNLSQTIEPGGTANYSLGITPSTGTSFPAAVTLSLSGLPSGATAAVTPSSWTQSTSTSWTLASGTTLSGNTQIAITVPNTETTRNDPKGTLFGRGGATALAILLLLPFAGRMRKTGRKLRNLTLSLLLLAALAAGMTACSAGTGYFSRTPKTYTIVVTVSSGSYSQSTNMTLTVE